MLRLRRLPPVRALLKSRFERNFPTARGFSSLCGSYASFADAARAVPPDVTLGYDHEASAGLYQDRLDAIRPKDYPALFWLARAMPEARRVVDLGGHVGLVFYAYRRYLDYPPGLRWTVFDVPAVVREGEALARRRGEGGIDFTTRVEDAAGADVLLAAGSLQYIERPFADVIGALAVKPPHVVVNDMPTHPDRQIITLQNIGVSICPYRIVARDALPAALDALAATHAFLAFQRHDHRAGGTNTPHPAHGAGGATEPARGLQSDAALVGDGVAGPAPLTNQRKLMYGVAVTLAALDLTRAAHLFHALSDETRLGILEMLRDGERCVCDLQEALDAAQSRLSFHLRVLKEAGLVTDRKEGRWSYYTLVPDAFAEAHDLVRALATEQPRGRKQLRVFGRCCG